MYNIWQKGFKCYSWPFKISLSLINTYYTHIYAVYASLSPSLSLYSFKFPRIKTFVFSWNCAYSLLPSQKEFVQDAFLRQNIVLCVWYQTIVIMFIVILRADLTDISSCTIFPRHWRKKTNQNIQVIHTFIYYVLISSKPCKSWKPL